MGRKSLALLTGAMLLILLVGSMPAGADSDRGGSGPSLRVDAPARAQVGRPIEVKLAVRGATDVGGYEADLLFDADAAQFASPYQQKGDLGNSGRGVESLGPVSTPQGGVSIGAFSCSAKDCAKPGREGGRARLGVGGTVDLATLTVVPQEAGRLEFKLGATKVVDTDGVPVDVGSKNETLTVLVGSQKTNTIHAAPKAIPRSANPGSSSRPSDFDIAGNGRVDYADAVEGSIAWTALREGGEACGEGAADFRDRDVDRDGCVDVADLQAIAANYGSGETNDLRSSAATADAAEVDAAESSTFIVDATADEADANPGDGTCVTSQGACTLRAAIAESNLHSGPDTIAFAIPGSGVQTINIASTLPTINDATGPTTIDGYTQPGAAPNTDTLASNARITVQVTTPRKYDPAIYGLTVASTGNTIRGLSVYGIQKNIWLYQRQARGNTVAGNFIGTNAAASYFATGFREHGEGVAIQGGASLNEIGVANPAGRNVISGNARRGVSFFPAGTDSNRVVNNIVGLGPSGTARVPNWKIGVDLNVDASNNQIGGTQQYERNVLAGNGEANGTGTGTPGQGIEMSHGIAVAGNRVIGNFFGTDLAGTAGPAYAALAGGAVNFEDRTGVGNLIEGNVIGNSRVGVRLMSAGNAQIRDNKIGVSLDGSPIPNADEGIEINTLDQNRNPAAGSEISGNVITNSGKSGITIAGIYGDNDRNIISRNSIFANGIGNGRLGIDIEPLRDVNPNDAGDADDGANQQLNFPEIETATTQVVSGTACANCTVEVFKADAGAGAHGQGRVFIDAVQADGNGTFTAAAGGLAAGEYATATATDAAGNTSEFSLNARVSVFDTTPPETTIDSGPEGTVASDSATFTFSSEEGAAFECSLDGAAFTGCSSPAQYDNLAYGQHTFRVRATDAAGNTDASAASRTWTVDSNISPPVVQAPKQALFAPSTLGTTAVPVKLTWSATDDGNVTSYELQQSVDGGPFAGVALSPATATAKTLQLQPGKAYEFRVRATDDGGNTSDWAAGGAFSVDAQQENSAAISYAGAWTDQASGSAYGGGLRFAPTRGAVATIDFTGQSIAWAAPKGPNRGRAEVLVDGTVVKVMDLYAAAEQPRRVVFTQSWDTSGPHTLQVRVLGTKKPSSSGTRVDVDAFVVLR